MKNSTLLCILCLMMFYNIAWAQWPPNETNVIGGCAVTGKMSINGNMPAVGAKIAFLTPDLTGTYTSGGFILDEYFTHFVDAPAGTEFVMVVYSGGLYYIFPSNGNGNTFQVDCTPAFTTNVGFGYSGTDVTHTITGTGCPTLACLLPVEFLSFTARAEENSVRLDWATGFEEGNDFFTVERSRDGAAFEILKEIPGAGTTYEQQNYSWIDDSPLPGTSYYRLKQTDFDGTFAYSDVASVRMDGILNGQSLRIFPNPTETLVRISVPSMGQARVAVMRIFNQVGQLVLQEEHSTEGQLLELDISTLPSGLYTLNVQQGARTYSEKLVVK